MKFAITYRADAFLLVVGLFGMLPTYGATPAYDILGRLVGIENADGSGIDYTYDTNGNITSKIPYKAAILFLSVEPPNAGTVTGAGSYRRNTSTALTATPESAFDFLGWYSAAGTLFSTDPEYFHLIADSETIIARFAPIAAPLITLQPIGGHFTAAGPISLLVTSQGREPFTYEWRRNEIPVSNERVYSVPNSTFLDAGTYRVDVRNVGGVTASQSALVSIPIENYAVWRNAIFLPEEIASNNPAVIGPEAKIGTDDLSNRVRFALGGTNRINHDEGAFGLPTEGEFFFRRLIGGGGLSYKLGLSTDTVSWDETGEHLELASGPIPNADGITESVSFRIKTSSHPIFPRSFFRLAISDATNAGMDSLVFADSFDEPEINTQIWNSTGNTVSQEGGILKITAAAMDQYGRLGSNPIPFNPHRTVSISRKVFFHASNNYCLPSWKIGLGSLPGITVQYGSMIYNGSPHRSVMGLTIMRNGLSAHQAGTEADQSAVTLMAWDLWFNEKVIYDPITGELEYSINDTKVIGFNVGIMPANSINTLVLEANAAGWDTGHQHFMDDLRIVQPNN